MGKGGYTGGSTIIGPWSSGWFSRPKAKTRPTEEQVAAKAKRKAKAQEKERARVAAKLSAEGRRKAARVAASKDPMIAPAEPRTKAQRAAAKQKELKRQPVHRGDPEAIAAKLARHMEGVEVRTITRNTLRLRKPKD